MPWGLSACMPGLGMVPTQRRSVRGAGMTPEGKMMKLSDKFRIKLVNGGGAKLIQAVPFAILTLRPCSSLPTTAWLNLPRGDNVIMEKYEPGWNHAGRWEPCKVFI